MMVLKKLSRYLDTYSSTNFRIMSMMTDIAKKVKNASQDTEAKIKTEEDHAQGKPSSETLNKAKVKVRDAKLSSNGEKAGHLITTMDML
jgi:hypothetical protein